MRTVAHHTKTSGTVRVRPNSQIDTLFLRAKQLHQHGDAQAAVELYRQIVERSPDHAAALHLLGFATFQLGDLQTAEPHVRRAVSLEPGNGEYHNSLALILLCRLEIEEAKKHAEQATVNGYRDPTCMLHVGVELFHKRQFDAAAQCCNIALSRTPHFAEAYNLLGMTQKQLGRVDEARTCYEAALGLRPDYCEALNNLGNALRDAGRPHEALQYYEKAISHDASFAAAHNNLGLAFVAIGSHSQALNCFTKACDLDPQSPDANNNLGNTLRDLGRTAEAEASFREALRRSPNSPAVYNNLGVVLQADERFQEASDCFRLSLQLDPAQPLTTANLASVLLSRGAYRDGEAMYRKAAQLGAGEPLLELRSETVFPPVFDSAAAMESRWDRALLTIKRCGDLQLPSDVSGLPGLAGPPPFNTQFYSQNLRQFREAYASVFQRLHRIEFDAGRKRTASQRIRVGMVVTAGHEGIFAKSLGAVLSRLDAQRFEILVLCQPSGSESLRSRLVGEHVLIRPFPVRLDLAARAIAESACDILYYWEVGTDTTNYFLPFFRLAGIQCTSWGIQVTSGIPTLDYYLSNSLVEPENAQDHYSERLVLADTLLTHRQPFADDQIGPDRNRFGLSHSQAVFVCAQQPGKFHPDFDETLRELLSRGQNRVLVLTGDRNGQAVRLLEDRWRRVMGKQFRQILFLPRLDHADYVSLLVSSDVLLDPPYFGGVNTTYDGLSLAKPIVTCPSPYHRGRYTLGCYRKMGVASCIVNSMADYVDLADRLATDADFRTAVERELRERRDVLFGDAAAVTEHERLFEELVKSHASK